jgi:hypothetical protein
MILEYILQMGHERILWFRHKITMLIFAMVKLIHYFAYSPVLFVYTYTNNVW